MTNGARHDLANASRILARQAAAGEWIFRPLPRWGFDLIVADPPWHLEAWGRQGPQTRHPQRHYPTLRPAQIAAFPVGRLAAEHSLLFLWATWPMLPQALEVMAAWGFRYLTGGPWVKRRRDGGLARGTGYRLVNVSEPFLLGARGRPATRRGVEGYLDGLRREHSVKPPEAFDLLRRLVPGTPRRVELFARQARPGWQRWGLEAPPRQAREG